MKISETPFCGQQIIIFLLGLSIGSLLMVTPLCKQKDSMIRLLMKNSNNTIQIPNLPKITG